MSSARLRAVLAAVLIVLALAAPGAGETPWDVRGRWDWVNVITACPKGSSCAPTVVIDMTITDQDPATGSIAGTWVVGEKVWQITGAVEGDRLDRRRVPDRARRRGMAGARHPGVGEPQ